MIEEVGFRVASFIRSTFGPIYGKRILAVIGRGNNGADAKAAAKYLRRFGAVVEEVRFSWDDAPISGEGYDLLVDGIFGTGISRPLQGKLIDAHEAKVVSIDLPSGVNLLIEDQEENCVRADVTLIIGALKLGQLGQAVIEKMGEAYLWHFDDLDSSHGNNLLFEASDIVFRREVMDEHKWKRAMHVVGGSKATLGAALLAGVAGFMAGAGLVRVSGNFERPDVLQAAYPELIVGDEAAFERDLATINRFKALVVGPGLGDRSENLLKAVLRSYSGPIVIDADGINAISTSKDLQVQVKSYEGPILLTPHGGEVSRLFGGLDLEVNEESIRSFVEDFGVDLLLKGFPTRIYSSDGRTIFVAANRSNLSVAGSGDVLSGILGSFIARDGYSLDAVASATYIHGLTGGRGVTNPISMIDALPKLVDSIPSLSSRRVTLPGNFKPIVYRGPLVEMKDSALSWRLPW